LALKQPFHRSKFSQSPKNGPKIGANSVTASRLISKGCQNALPSEQNQSVTSKIGAPVS